MRLKALVLAFLWMSVSAGACAADSSETDASPESIRLYATDGTVKKYYTGFDWVQLDFEQKIELVEQARRGALKLHTVMTQPAEIYIAELDRMYQQNPDVRHIEVGQAITGIAISLKDWDDGSDQGERLKGYLAPEKS